MPPLHINVIRLNTKHGNFKKCQVKPFCACSKPNLRNRLGFCALRKENGNYVLLCIVLLNIKRRGEKNKLTYIAISILFMFLCLSTRVIDRLLNVDFKKECVYLLCRLETQGIFFQSLYLTKGDH